MKKILLLLTLLSVNFFYSSAPILSNVSFAPNDCWEYAENIEWNYCKGCEDYSVFSLAYDYCEENLNF